MTNQQLPNRTMGLLMLLVSLVVASASTAQSSTGLDVNEGVVPKNELPRAMISEELVVLNVPQIRQKPGYCVPTSCAMIVRFFGESESPVALKKLAENHKPVSERNTEFTYWADMHHALKSKGKDWRIQKFAKTEEGYQLEFEAIKASLRNGLPVMIEVHLALKQA